MRLSVLALAAALSAMGAITAMAMDKETSAAEAQVRALGKRWDGEVLQQTTRAYMPVETKVQRQGIAATRDIAYGSDAKQKLDIYVTAKKPHGRAVVVYVHGGGLSGGDKDSTNTDGLINSNVPVYFAHHGMIGVNLNYRLVPGITYPQGGEDLASAVTWLRANIAQYGGDPNAIFLIGHSAGGFHLATYLYEPKVNGTTGPQIAGAIFLSGVIELDKDGPRLPVTKQYYGDDPSRWAALDPYAKIDAYKGKRVPTFIINAELDPSEIELPGGVRHYAKLCVLDKACPRYFQAQNMNHLSTSLSLGSDDDSLGYQLRDFVRKTLAAGATKTAQKM